MQIQKFKNIWNLCSPVRALVALSCVNVKGICQGLSAPWYAACATKNTRPWASELRSPIRCHERSPPSRPPSGIFSSSQCKIKCDAPNWTTPRPKAKTTFPQLDNHKMNPRRWSLRIHWKVPGLSIESRRFRRYDVDSRRNGILLHSFQRYEGPPQGSIMPSGCIMLLYCTPTGGWIERRTEIRIDCAMRCPTGWHNWFYRLSSKITSTILRSTVLCSTLFTCCEACMSACPLWPPPPKKVIF